MDTNQIREGVKKVILGAIKIEKASGTPKKKLIEVSTQIAIDLQDEFGIEIPVEHEEEFVKRDKIIEYIQQRLKNPQKEEGR